MVSKVGKVGKTAGLGRFRVNSRKGSNGRKSSNGRKGRNGCRSMKVGKRVRCELTLTLCFKDQDKDVAGSSWLVEHARCAREGGVGEHGHRAHAGRAVAGVGALPVYQPTVAELPALFKRAAIDVACHNKAGTNDLT